MDRELISPRDEETATEGMRRRTFLASLGLMALSGCGAGNAFDNGGPAGATRARALAATTPAGTPFIHPGVQHGVADFARMAQRYTQSPWVGSWNLLLADPKVTLTRTASAVPIIYRGSGVPSQNYSRLDNDSLAMYGMLLRWKISGDPAWAERARIILNAWTSTLTAIQGSDAGLSAGGHALYLSSIAEMLRDYSGFTSADMTAAKNLLRNVIYPVCHDLLANHGGRDPIQVNANWYLNAIAGTMATGVLLDDRAIFDEAVYHFTSGDTNGALKRAAYYMFPGNLCEWQESGRDQDHAIFGLSCAAMCCEIAWHQGVDLYGLDNNRFLAALEYTAKGNLIQSGSTYYSVPYVWYANGINTWSTFSTLQQGITTPFWAIVYNHYVNRKGLAAPYTTRMKARLEPEGQGYIPYGTLAYTIDPLGTATAPSGLTGYVNGGTVLLSWWGGVTSAGASTGIQYTVQRSAVAGGPYTVVASGITDPLTYTDTPPSDGTWYYVVTADHFAGAKSNEVAVLRATRLHTRLPCDEGTGTTVADTSGNGHAGTLAGGATWAPGRSGNALAFNGSSAYVDLPAGLMDDLSDFTVSTWVYWNAFRKWERVFDFGGGQDRHMFFTPSTGSNRARFSMTLTGFSGCRFVEGPALPTGRWVHVAVTLSGQTATLYVDGAAVGTTTSMDVAPFRIWNTTINQLGRSKYAADAFFNGKIDDFRIYRGALSASDIATLKNGAQDVSASVQFTQQGATYNRVTGQYVGSVKVTNTSGAALAGPLQLELANLTGGVTLANASGLDGTAPYVTLAAPLAAGATINVPLTFNNPARSIVAYTPRLLRGYL